MGTSYDYTTSESADMIGDPVEKRGEIGNILSREIYMNERARAEVELTDLYGYSELT